MPILITNLHSRLRFPPADAEWIVRTVMRSEGTSISDINVVFVNHQRIIALNKKYLHHRRTTDVIAFFYENSPAEGDIFVNLDQARQQRKIYRASFREEVARLIIHGALHLAGYDDSTTSNRKKMGEREDRYLRLLSLKGKKRAA